MATEDPTVVVEPTNAEPPAKEKEESMAEAAKDPKPKKASKPRIPASHPSYEEMIKDAIVTLKEKTGSSQYAITKFIEEKHKQLPPNFRKLLLYHLKKNVGSGKLVKVKGSFKLSPVIKPSSVTTSSVAKKIAAAPKPNAIAKAKNLKTIKAAAAKPKPKGTANPKALKPKAATAKPKPKVAAKPKPKERPTKAARTSTRTSPGKKATAAKKAPAKSVKPKSVKSSVKKASTKRGGRK